VPFKFSQKYVEPTFQLVTCLEPNSCLQFFICLSVPFVPPAHYYLQTIWYERTALREVAGLCATG